MRKDLSYWQRWLKKTKDETALFAKRRLVFAGCMAIIVSTALWYFGKTQLTVEDLVKNLAILAGCYLFVWGLSFVVNVFRAPALLNRAMQIMQKEAQDAIAGQLVESQNQNALLQESISKQTWPENRPQLTFDRFGNL